MSEVTAPPGPDPSESVGTLAIRGDRLPCTIMATGDFMISHDVVRPDATHLETLWEGFRAADVTFANLEGTFTTMAADSRSDKLTARWSDPSLAVQLARCGITVVNLANNQAVSFGVDGLRDTRFALRNAGIATVGAGENIDEAFRPFTVECSGVRVAFLGLTTSLPNGSAAGSARPGLAPVRVITRFVVDPVMIDEIPGMAPFVETVPMPGDVERACDYATRVKRECDVLILGVHWGVPPRWASAVQGWRAGYQQPLGHALVDAGADLIVGHHTHTLQGIEVYRERPIFYSLGNTLFHTQRVPPDRVYPPYLRSGWTSDYGATVRVSWSGSSASPEQVDLWPLHMDPVNHEPSVARGDHADVAIGQVTALSEEFGTRFTRIGDVLTVVTR
jgi:poly-gamma-glutamate capsule biosynthesis protein CapA/YwtB (metallophosphatase superfamily)